MPIQYPADQFSSFQSQDHTLFSTKTNWSRLFYAAGTVDNSPNVDFYLKDEKGSQAIYVPEGSSCVVRWTAIYNMLLSAPVLVTSPLPPLRIPLFSVSS
jgi:hypothetical protein